MTGTIKGQDGSAATPSYAFVGSPTTGFYKSSAGFGVTIGGSALGIFFTANGLVNVANVPQTIPVGALMDYAGAAAPSGWLLCFGQSLSTTTYALLFAAIGYTYGGSGANFSLPDYRGRTSYGVDNMGGSTAGRVTNAGSGIVGTTLGATGGAQNQTATTDQIPAHTHAVSITTGGQSQTHVHGPGSRATDILGDSGNVDLTVASGAGVNFGKNSATAVNNQDHTHLVSGTSAANTTAGSPITTMNPAIMINKIIFAGA